MPHNGDETTPPNGPRIAVPGGEVGLRLHNVEVRLIDLDTRDAQQHAEIAARLDAMAKGLEDVGAQVVGRLDALAAAYQQTLTLRAFAVVEAVAARVFTTISAPIYAIAVLVFAVALTATTIRYGELVVGRTVDARVNEDSASDGGGAGISAPSPQP